jgi:hypothetical protein
MPIVLNNFNSNTPFYVSHTPFTTPENLVPINSLAQMVEINYNIPTGSVVINQIYGAEDRLGFVIKIKNKTTNFPLDISIDAGDFFIVEHNTFTLSPLEEKELLIVGNNSYINSKNYQYIFDTALKIKIKNNISDNLAYISKEYEEMEKEDFPEEFNII